MSFALFSSLRLNLLFAVMRWEFLPQRRGGRKDGKREGAGLFEFVGYIVVSLPVFFKLQGLQILERNGVNASS